MSLDDRDDPGADTAMFRAYVDGDDEPAAAGPAANRTLLLAIAAVVAVAVLVAIIVMAS